MSVDCDSDHCGCGKPWSHNDDGIDWGSEDDETVDRSLAAGFACAHERAGRPMFMKFRKGKLGVNS